MKKMSAADEIVKRHDELFGEGSWDKMAKQVAARHPMLEGLLERCDEELERLDQSLISRIIKKKWWEFWK